MKLMAPKHGDTDIAGTLAIAAPGASCAVDFSRDFQKPRNFCRLRRQTAFGITMDEDEDRTRRREVTTRPPKRGRSNLSSNNARSSALVSALSSHCRNVWRSNSPASTLASTIAPIRILRRVSSLRSRRERRVRCSASRPRSRSTSRSRSSGKGCGGGRTACRRSFLMMRRPPRSTQPHEKERIYLGIVEHGKQTAGGRWWALKQGTGTRLEEYPVGEHPTPQSSEASGNREGRADARPSTRPAVIH